MSEIDPKLGELIKKKRIERQLTQEEVAELVGCHPQYYKNLENGKGMPSLPMFCKIMWTLHISADEYVWPAQYPDNPTYKSLLNLLGQCDEYMLSVLLATAEGQIVTWAACLLLRSISGDRFSEVPLFEFSIVGILAGVVVGFLIVLLASLSPAKKASRVSPVTAISGSSQLTQNKRAANTKLFHVETGMGMFHALSGKKNLFLMTCSFAISIMLFLSFQVMVVFLDQGMPALAPWAGDVSVTAAAGLEPSVIEEIAGMEGVKRAFGRMEYSGLSVSSDTESGTAALVSYEENQFKWAEEELNEGNTESVQGGTGDVLVTYRDGMQWKAGDTVTLHTPLGRNR